MSQRIDLIYVSSLRNHRLDCRGRWVHLSAFVSAASVPSLDQPSQNANPVLCYTIYLHARTVRGGNTTHFLLWVSTTVKCSEKKSNLKWGGLGDIRARQFVHFLLCALHKFKKIIINSSLAIPDYMDITRSVLTVIYSVMEEFRTDVGMALWVWQREERIVLRLKICPATFWALFFFLFSYRWQTNAESRC